MLRAVRKSKFFSKFRESRKAARWAARKSLAAFKRARYKAKIIAITGSSAKSTTTELLRHIVAPDGRVVEQKPGNSELSTIATISNLRRYDDFVILEMGTKSPGVIPAIASVALPDIGIVTMVAMEHKSAFRELEAIAKEKGALVPFIRDGGLVVLNADDPNVASMRSLTTQKVVTFGKDKEADYMARDIILNANSGMSLTMIWKGNSLALRTKLAGEHFWLATLAAAATAIEMGIPPEKVAERIVSFEPVFGRCSRIQIPGGPVFIVDTIKAPWHSVTLAFDVLSRWHAPKKRLVLGHMSDFTSNAKYRDAYALARSIADQVIFVGNHSHRSKASDEDREEGRFMAFSTTKEAAEYIRSTATEGEVILLKGSTDLHLERIALAFRNPVKCWADACGSMVDCTMCGCWGSPYPEHRGRRRKGRNAPEYLK